jgi:phosphoribosyl-ATP pyrophosphohydrolase/phosphoribosyl-AMP cyclohydrolase
MTDRRLSLEALDGLTFDERGLIPVVAQDASRGAVLMVAWSHKGALTRTLETGELHLWSRSRGALWRKGETSGNVLRVVSLHADCDSDVVLALVDPAGPACHTGEVSCFGEGALALRASELVPDATGALQREDATVSDAPVGDALDALWRVLAARARERPAGSYTTRLLSDENLRVKKLGEEVSELVMALSRRDPDRIRAEAADLVYHLLVALLATGVSLGDLQNELASRQK